VKKPIFAPIPARAAADPELSGLQLRVLAVIAMHDRFGKNGQGCWASGRTLAAIVRCEYSRLSDAISRLRERGYITTSRHPTNGRLLVHRVVYSEADANTLPNGKPSSLDGTLCETANRLPDSLPPSDTLSNEINGVRSPIDEKVYSVEAVRDSAEAVERDSAKAAHVASRHASLAKPKIQKGSAHVGATLAHLERQLRAGSTEYLTSEWADWLSTVHADGDYGDPNTGRAFRLLNEFEFPL
jgi:DNA-binding MarR family transcriptional regulator